MGTAFSIISDYPVLQLRLRSPDTAGDSQWEQTFKMISADTKCFDEVWFSTGIGVPSVDWHKKNAECITRSAKLLRQSGIKTGLQIQATIGHADDLSSLERTDGKSWLRNYGSRSAQSIIVEAFSALMTGMTSASMLITHTGNESPELYAGSLITPISAAAPVLKGYASSCKGTVPAGFSSNLSVNKLYAFAHTGIPVLFGAGCSLGELNNSDADIDRCLVTSVEIQNMRDNLDRQAGGTPAVLKSPFVGLMLPRVMEDGKLKNVALLNVRIDAQGPLVLRLQGIPTDATMAVWHELRREPKELSIYFEDNHPWVTIPEISAWNGGYLDFK